MWYKRTSASYTALVYVTVGALLLVWSGIWHWRLWQTLNDPNDGKWYWCYGFMATGLVLLLIGLAIGHIRKAAARRSETPAVIAMDTVTPVSTRPPGTPAPLATHVQSK